MKSASIVMAMLVVVVANIFALRHAAHNRSGRADAEITVTQRELRYSNRLAHDENSGVTLDLRWLGPAQFLPSSQNGDLNWLNAEKLRQLGFDCGVDPSGHGAPRFYQRQRPRRVFVALEYDGPAWERWRDAYQKSQLYGAAATDSSHLVAIDADLDPARLRTNYPDRTKVLVMPAVVAIALTNEYFGARVGTGPPVLRGNFREVPSSIHVPLPFSEEFRQHAQNPGIDPGLSYRVKLRFGAAYEPEVVGVEFTR